MPTYKPSEVIKELKKHHGCETIKGSGGSHQKIRQTDTGLTSVVITNRDLVEHEVKTIYTQLGLKWEK